MIRKPTDIPESKKYFMVIAGPPGIGKTTLGLSAPSPLLINLDGKYTKVSPEHRIAPHITPQNYQEVITDLKTEDLSEFKTLVFDTGGELVRYMTPYVIRKNARNGQRDGMTLSLPGYGAIMKEYEALIMLCLNELKKHIVIIFHTVERAEDEQTVHRIDIAGGSGRFVWKKSDIGGFMNVVNGKRTIEFASTASHYGKSAYGIQGLIEIPHTKTSTTNTLITDLFTKADHVKAAEKELEGKYNDLMENVRQLISDIKTAEDANGLIEQFKDFEWIYAGKNEAAALLQIKCADLGLKYSRENKCYEEGKECLPT